MSQLEVARGLRLPREQRVAEIMRAARTVFSKRGYDAASVAEIAEIAGVVEGSVYRYFDTKRALLVRVVEDWYEEMLSDYDEHLRGIQGTWNRLRYMVWRHLASIAREPAMCRLVFGELRPSADYRATSVFQLNRRYTQRTTEILQQGVDAGELRSDVSLALARDLIYGTIEHHTWSFLRGEGSFDLDATADAITDIVYRGLAASNAGHVSVPGTKRRRTKTEKTLARLEKVVVRLEAMQTATTKRKKTA